MNEQKRMVLMLITVCLLIVANLAMRMQDGEGASSFFEGLGDLEEGWSAQLKVQMKEIEAMPVLNLRTSKGAGEPADDARNPFLFGVDRAREAEQKARMEALADARAEMEAQRAAAVETVVADPEPVLARFDGQVLGVMENADTGDIMIGIKYKDVYHVLRPGDSLEDTYRLVSATPERVRLLALASSQEIDIELDAQ